MRGSQTSRSGKRDKASSFVIQGSILALAGIVVRLIGMLYRIPMINIIGKTGNGYYTSAYNVYNILLILSSYSMPVAMSKMVATRMAKGEYRNVQRLLGAAMVYATVVGGAAAGVMWFGAEAFAGLLKTPFSMYALKTLAPTIWIMAYLGVLRGYFQGMGTMVPTALSQILEQIVNAVISLVAASMLFDLGTAMNQASGATEYSYALGAAGGTIGTGAGTVAALLFFAVLTMTRVPAMNRMAVQDQTGKKDSWRQMIRVMTLTILPIVISSTVYNISNVVDNTLFGQGMSWLGSQEQEIATLWGILGQYQLLFNIPVAVSNSLTSSLIPSLTRAVASHDHEQGLKRIALAVRFSMLIAIPAAVGLTVLAGPINNLLFGGGDNTIVIRLTMLGSLAVVFYSLSTVTNGILQGLNRMKTPIYHALISLVFHVAALEIMLLLFRWGIYSVVFANILFAFLMCLLNARSIARVMGYRQEIRRTFVIPAVSAAAMGAGAWCVCRLTGMILPDSLADTRPGLALEVGAAVGAALVIYAFVLVALKGISQEELKDMPGGTRICRLMKKLRLM